MQHLINQRLNRIIFTSISTMDFYKVANELYIAEDYQGAIEVCDAVLVVSFSLYDMFFSSYRATPLV